MAKEFYIEQASKFENQAITTSFVVSSKQIKPKKSGEPYLALTLVDRTGQIDAKMWDNVPETIPLFEHDDFVKVRGVINQYNGRFQLTINKLRKMDETEVDFADYLPRTGKDVNELWAQVADHVSQFKDPHLKALIEAFMRDPEIERGYKNAPAAKTLHHAYIGGLLDHVASLFRSCDLITRNYPQINRDLLMAGIFLHDIGKLHELTYARSFSYSTKGQLLGHMIIELEMLHSKIAEVPGFPDELKTLVEHLIISHHGQYEFGSPKLPMFAEALMLHYLDDLDSKMEAIRAHIERESRSGTEWTGYNASLGRPLLDSARFLSKPKPEEKAAAATASGEAEE
jgi:3'-5' exoribonuclease